MDVSSRYFYHSFPRRAHHDADRAKRILASISKNGLLLVPEEVSWTDPTQNDKSMRIHAIQRRACFTELTSDELGQHANVFGAFAIEADEKVSGTDMPVWEGSKCHWQHVTGHKDRRFEQ